MSSRSSKPRTTTTRSGVRGTTIKKKTATPKKTAPKKTTTRPVRKTTPVNNRTGTKPKKSPVRKTATKSVTRTSGAKKTSSAKKINSAKKTASRGRGVHKKTEAELDAEDAEYERQQAANEKRRVETNARLKAEREAAEKKKKEAADLLAMQLTPDAQGRFHVPIKLLPTAMDLVWESKKTPLVVDNSKRVDTFFRYADGSPIILMAKALVVKIAFQKQDKNDVLEELARPKLVNALKMNKTLVINMENSACDFTQYTNPASFPANDVFTHQKCIEESVWSQFVRESEKQYGIFIPGEDFKAAVVSHFQLEDVPDFLAESIPLDLMTIIEILPAE